MGEATKIEWAHHTFNPWIGCTKVSAACDHCYAESWAKRTGSPGLWQGERRLTSDAYWRQPRRWNAAAKRDGVRRRVFCASLADVFDNQVPPSWRHDLWSLIATTSHLDWLLLTKRPQNIAKMLPATGAYSIEWPWPNVWLGTTVENQAEAERRIPHLLSVRAAVHFLSCEPLLGDIDLRDPLGLMWYVRSVFHVETGTMSAPRGQWAPSYNIKTGERVRSQIDWVICGGESGPGARPMRPDWARSLRDQCAVAGVRFFFKQWGEWDARGERVGKARAGRLLDGREHNEFPHPDPLPRAGEGTRTDPP